MQTFTEAATIVGRMGYWRCGDGSADANAIKVRVIVVDTRKVFSRVDYRIAPESGTGIAWVSADSVTLD